MLIGLFEPEYSLTLQLYFNPSMGCTQTIGCTCLAIRFIMSAARHREAYTSIVFREGIIY